MLRVNHLEMSEREQNSARRNESLCFSWTISRGPETAGGEKQRHEFTAVGKRATHRRNSQVTPESIKYNESLTQMNAELAENLCRFGRKICNHLCVSDFSANGIQHSLHRSTEKSISDGENLLSAQTIAARVAARAIDDASGEDAQADDRERRLELHCTYALMCATEPIARWQRNKDFNLLYFFHSMRLSFPLR